MPPLSSSVTDDRFRHARPDRAWIESLARSHVTPHLKAGSVVVTEGFIGATPDGVPTTMGFEASDLTAALLGAALEATEIQIWTDVAGMLTMGHPAVANPRVIPRLTFDEAAELALFGASAQAGGTRRGRE
jgi:aspartate kinase